MEVDFEEMERMKREDERDLRDGILGEGVAKCLHGAVNLGPVVAHAIAILGAHDNGDAEVALGVGVPLLLSGRHDEEGGSCCCFCWRERERERERERVVWEVKDEECWW
jgi:hypothetical protein